jgi:mono/diheme cytochrome c family protein
MSTMKSPHSSKGKMSFSSRMRGRWVPQPAGRAAAGLALGVLVGGIVLLGFSIIPNPTRGPVQASSKQGREAGAVVFHEKGCEHCHGVDGVGTDRAPALTTVGKRRNKAQIEQQIEKGGHGMPAYGKILQPDQVKWLVEFLHAKRKAPKKAPVTVAPATPAAAAPSASDPGF